MLSILNWTSSKHITFSCNFLRLLSSYHTLYMSYAVEYPVWATNTSPVLQHSG